jgi:hypothetical protein
MSTGVFFGASAWASLYYVGAIESLRASDRKVLCAGGSSAGALFALALLLDKNTEELRGLWLELAELGHVHGCVNKVSIYQDMLLRRWLPAGGTEYTRLNGRLFVGISTFPATAQLLDTWSNNLHLRDDLHASMHIPLYSTYMTKRFALDGGFCQSFWDLPGVDTTIYVSPIEGHAHVTPLVGLSSPLYIAWPVLEPSTQERLVHQGRLDMSAYLTTGMTTTPSWRYFARLRVLRVCVLCYAWPTFLLRRMLHGLGGRVWHALTTEHA